MRQLQCCFK